MLREDNVKDDNGHKAVFTEQGASASRVAAGTLLNTISRLHGVEKANDAVSACAQAHMSEAPSPLRSPEKRMPTCARLPAGRRPKQWDTNEEPVVPLERNLFHHLLAGLLWERRLEDVLFKNEKRRHHTNLENVMEPPITTTVFVCVCERH